ncbi:hypothetical protein QA640_08975 [Bradyrhizobium sp. CB82]|uniref:hypothetical protein n=1 Tax=Bradyrhizobium sp. CB82 TaxID=3039159 RepID=UPI0024B181CC|nr:hypothetical protein [Bradyrhizobium sp. CB82]WFU42577.1 hypothetical protein QA640_08975 [Bradyrhizobium sp. CB82]
MTIIELLEYVKTAGGLAAPIFAILFWLERNERQDAQRELKEVAENSVVAMIELKAVVAQLSAIFDPHAQYRNRR